MRDFSVTVFAGALAMFAPALAQTDSAGSGDLQLSANMACGQMKLRVLAVHGSPTSTPIAEGTTGKPSPNESGNTARTTAARHEIAAGDAACSGGDTMQAHVHYQRAIDELTASR